MKELSLRPYPGKLFIAESRKEYERLHRKMFKEIDEIDNQTAGRTSVGGYGKKNTRGYLLWAGSRHILVHELAHVVLDLFDYCGINPTKANGEPFCYMQAQLFLEATKSK